MSRSNEDRTNDHIVTFSPEKEQEILETITSCENTVVASMIGSTTDRAIWKHHHGTRDGIHFFQTEQSLHGHIRICGVTELNTPLIDLVQFLIVNDNESLMRNVRVMYDNVIDARLLAVIKQPTKENPMECINVRHTSFKLPLFIKSRDSLLVGVTNMHTLSDGSQIGYSLSESIETSACPELPTRVRAKLSESGFFMFNSGAPGAPTKVCYLMCVNPCGSVPQVIASKVLYSMTGVILRRFCGHFQRLAVDPESFSNPNTWVPQRLITSCQTCRRDFGPLSRRNRCISCGNVVCPRCSFTQSISVRGGKNTNARLCVECQPKAGQLNTSQVNRRVCSQNNAERKFS